MPRAQATACRTAKPNRVFLEGPRARTLAVLAAALLFGTHGVSAQGYERIAAVLDGAPSSDNSLYAARDELLAIVIRDDGAALARRVSKNFFWDRDHGGGFDPKRRASDNLAAAASRKSLRSMLSASIATPRREGSTDHCLPARLRPKDEKQLARVSRQLQADPFFDWGVVSDSQVIRAGPDETAAEAGVLSREVVRVLDWAFEAPEGRRRWVKVVTPRGAQGYVEGHRIVTLAPERLCLRKDPDGVWRISGYIGGGD